MLVASKKSLYKECSNGENVLFSHCLVEISLWCDCGLLYDFGCGNFGHVSDSSYSRWFLFTAYKAYLN